MKKTLTLVALLGAALTLTTVAPAQTSGPNGGPPKLGGQGGGKRGGGMRLLQMNKQILAKLDLTPAQKARVQALDKATMEKVQALRKGGKGAKGTKPSDSERESMRKKSREISKSHREGLMAILTPTQRQRYQELWKAEMQKLRQQRGQNGGRRGGKGGAKPGGTGTGG